MNGTPYFEKVVLVHPARTYLRRDLCEGVVRDAEKTEPQADGRIRHWAWVAEDGHYWRVVTLADGETLHNAFRDRRYKGARR